MPATLSKLSRCTWDAVFKRVPMFDLQRDPLVYRSFIFIMDVYSLSKINRITRSNGRAVMALASGAHQD
jgi:hypothetical protein